MGWQVQQVCVGHGVIGVLAQQEQQACRVHVNVCGIQRAARKKQADRQTEQEEASQFPGCACIRLMVSQV